MDGVELTGLDLIDNYAACLTVVGEEHIQQLVLVEEVDVVLDPLLVKGLDDHVTGTVSGVAGAPNRSGAELTAVPAEPALIDLAIRCAIEGKPHVLQLDDRVDRLPREHLRRILIHQVVATLDGVEHVPFPVVLFRVPKRGADSTLRGTGV